MPFERAAVLAAVKTKPSAAEGGRPPMGQLVLLADPHLVLKLPDQVKERWRVAGIHPVHAAISDRLQGMDKATGRKEFVD